MVIGNQFDLCKNAKRKKMKSDYQRLKFKSLCFHHHICYLLINKVYHIPNLSLIRTSTRWLSLNVSIFFFFSLWKTLLTLKMLMLQYFYWFQRLFIYLMSRPIAMNICFKNGDIYWNNWLKMINYCCHFWMC